MLKPKLYIFPINKLIAWSRYYSRQRIYRGKKKNGKEEEEEEEEEGERRGTSLPCKTFTVMGVDR